jgi:hypothetical protein
MQKRASVSIFLLISGLILGMTIFAKELGLDPNPGWGKGRIALLIAGLLVAGLPWIAASRSAVPLARTDLFTLPVLLGVVAVYFWFVTVSYNSTSQYYSLLAGSFREGELALPLKPDPALLALPNPYDPVARQGIKVPMDLSLYDGKFYLYWGPAPSFLLAIAQPALPGKLREVDLLFLFMCGIFLSQYLLIMHVWQRFFPAIPKWMLLLSIGFAGFANPALWLLAQPKIYEAAIAGAQFFFIGGFASAVLALSRQTISRWGLVLAGTLWALAVGTRSIALFSVLFMTLMVVYLLFRVYGRSFFRFLVEVLPLGLPLAIGAVGFGWYNWARFGSLQETGFTYQLAAHHLQKHMSELFLPGYSFQNLYNYLLNPFTVRQSFPFLYPVRGVTQEILPWHILPDLYTAQAITGILCAVPFTAFAAVPIIALLNQAFRKNRIKDSNEDFHPLSLNWLTTSLLGSFAFPFLSLLAFFWAAMRYAEDFMPALILLSILGFWQGYQSLPPASRQVTIYTCLGTLLAGLSILLAACLALSIYYTNGFL